MTNPLSELPAPFSVRPGTLADATKVTACVLAAYARWVPLLGVKPGPMLDNYQEVLTQKQCFVAEHEEHLAGVLVLSVAEEGFLLENVAVHPNYLGQRLGAYFMSLAEREAHAQGYDSIYLYTHEGMRENIAYYTRLGYVEYARRFEIGLQRVYMRKMLDKQNL